MIERCWLLLLCIVHYQCQSIPTLTEPRLSSIVPVNSTALRVFWTFANSAFDQSDSIQINIVFNEYFYGYNRTYPAIQYQFDANNKTITNLTRNFELVGAHYFICFSSNSSRTNFTQYFLFNSECRLARTCVRSNQSCPSPASFTLESVSSTSNSFTVAGMWPLEIPYSPVNFTVQLATNNQSGALTSVTQNVSHLIRRYDFNNLQPSTNYLVNSVVYFQRPDNQLQQNTITLNMSTTSLSLSLFSTTSVKCFLFFLCFVFSTRCLRE